jgi:hypothetical protein
VEITGTEIEVKSYPYNSKVRICTSSLRAVDTSLLKREIIKSEEGKKVCEVDIDIFNIYSPNLKDAELIVRVNLSKLTILSHP